MNGYPLRLNDLDYPAEGNDKTDRDPTIKDSTQLILDK